jgi:beta-glucosidase
VLFVGGLTHQAGFDDENADRRDLSLPAQQDQLIARIAAANPRTAVVLIAGAGVDMTSWIAKAPAVLQAWYGGSEAGHALARVVFGDVSPSGKLPCTFPKSLKDSAAHAAGRARQFPGEAGKVWYDEGLLVGYRWNDTKSVAPLFPFGHGLSYTRFEYSALRSTTIAGADGPTTMLSLQVTNAGERAGAEVVQAYVHPVKPPVPRPEKELKAFAKVRLDPGETKVVTLSLPPRAFAYYAPDARAWRVAKGRYDLLVGASSRDIRLKSSVDVPESTLLR